MKALLKIIPIVSLLLSCAGSKIEKILRSGSVAQEKFNVTIPFEYKFGRMVVKADIQGKTYDFILDTGASNVLTSEFNAELGLKPIASEEVFGSQGMSQQLEYTSIDNIEIGGIRFENTIASIVNLNAVPEWACYQIKGIIGANLMRKAVWDIDFMNQTITITNAEENLDIPKGYNEAKFYIGYQGSPSIITKINGMSVLNMLIDTGFNGGIMYSSTEIEALLQKKKITNYISGTGKGIGVYGLGKEEKFYYGVIDEMRFGDALLQRPLVTSFGIKDQKIMGIEFLKNYRVIFNWNTKRLKFIELKPYENTELNSYGFGIYYEKDKVFVKYIVENSSAERMGLMSGDQIISVNDADYSSLVQKEYCKILEDDLLNQSTAPITLTSMRHGVQTKLILNKTTVLNELKAVK